MFDAPRYPDYRGKRVLTVRVCGRSGRGALGVNQVNARVQEVNQLASEFTVFSTSSTRATGKTLQQHLSGNSHRSSALLDDEDYYDVVNEDNYAHSNAPNDSHRQSTITAEVCSRLSVGGDDAARAARSARSLTDRAARTRR